MKHHVLSPVPKLLMRRASAEAALEHAGILRLLEQAGWIKPIITLGGKDNPYDFFSFEQLERAVRRMEKEKLPQ